MSAILSNRNSWFTSCERGLVRCGTTRSDDQISINRRWNTIEPNCKCMDLKFFLVVWGLMTNASKSCRKCINFWTNELCALQPTRLFSHVTPHLRALTSLCWYLLSAGSKITSSQREPSLSIQIKFVICYSCSSYEFCHVFVMNDNNKNVRPRGPAKIMNAAKSALFRSLLLYLWDHSFIVCCFIFTA